MFIMFIIQGLFALPYVSLAQDFLSFINSISRCIICLTVVVVQSPKDWLSTNESCSSSQSTEQDIKASLSFWVDTELLSISMSFANRLVGWV